jgi:hypothetical protein
MLVQTELASLHVTHTQDVAHLFALICSWKAQMGVNDRPSVQKYVIWVRRIPSALSNLVKTP